MLFSSYPFLFVFLPIVLGIYIWARRRSHVGFSRGWLLLSSLFFYGWWDPANLLVLLPSIVLNFAAGERLHTLCSTDRRRARALLAAAILGNVAVLCNFKYWDFLAATAAGVLSLPYAPRGLELPLGISFFTFQQIAYQVDIYRGQAGYHLREQAGSEDGRGFTTYALFISLFPHLIAGPIVHPGVLIPQLRDRRRSYEVSTRLAFGLTYFLVGLWKKTVLADHLSESANLLFDGVRQGGHPGTLPSWLGALAYAFQIYFDFSGYSDMAIGLAHGFGFSLPLNFNSPYKARTITEFWRRWHMTLSRFLRDYLYIPLGGNRKGHARRYLNLLLTMGLGGLWHGAGWTFVFWGLFHGLGLCVHSLWERGKKRFDLVQGLADRLFVAPVAQGLTFLTVVVGWVFFRADGFRSAAAIVRSLFFLAPSAAGAADQEFAGLIDGVAVAWLALAAFVAFVLPNTQEWMGYRDPEAAAPSKDHSPTSLLPVPRWSPRVSWVLPIGFLASVALTCVSRPSVFIYFRF